MTKLRGVLGSVVKSTECCCRVEYSVDFYGFYFCDVFTEEHDCSVKVRCYGTVITSLKRSYGRGQKRTPS